MNTSFAIEKPTPPVTIWLLSIVIVIGLLALGIAAYFAFIQVMPWYQALFSAFLIEVGAIVEAITLIRGNNWIAAAGLLGSLIVSGTYNFIQASTAGAAHGLTDWWQLITLAIGPLSSLTFLAMSLGREIRGHEKAMTGWQKQRQAWITAQQEERRKAEERIAEEKRLSEERARKDADEQAAASRMLELEKEKLRLETEKQMELAKFRAQLRAESRKDTDPDPETFRKVSDWRSLPVEDKKIIAGMDTSQIMQNYGVSDRTARNWRTKANANGFH